MADHHPEFDESLMPADEPDALSDIELTDAHWRYARLRWPGKTEAMQAYNMRRSIWARIQHRKPHPEDPTRRVLGGPQPRTDLIKRRREIGPALVEETESRVKEVVDAAFAPLAPGNDPNDRHRAAMNLAKHAREEKKEAREADEYARKTEDEVIQEAAEVIREMIRNGEISASDFVDSTAEEIPAAGEIAA